MTDDRAADEVDEYPPSPFSFKLMIGLAILYLGWRLIQGIMWLWDRLL